jgi:hypothetical protein
MSLVLGPVSRAPLPELGPVVGEDPGAKGSIGGPVIVPVVVGTFTLHPMLRTTAARRREAARNATDART